MKQQQPRKTIFGSAAQNYNIKDVIKGQVLEEENEDDYDIAQTEMPEVNKQQKQSYQTSIYKNTTQTATKTKTLTTQQIQGSVGYVGPIKQVAMINGIFSVSDKHSAYYMNDQKEIIIADFIHKYSNIYQEDRFNLVKRASQWQNIKFIMQDSPTINYSLGSEEGLMKFLQQNSKYYSNVISLGQLAKGGEAVVYRVEHQNVDEVVAKCTLLESQGSSSQQVHEAFMDMMAESQQLKLLSNHNYIAQVKEEIILLDDQSRLISQYVVIVERAQNTLHDLFKIWNDQEQSIQKFEIYSPEKILYYFFQMLSALEFVNQRGMYYGDMKPQNLLVFRDQLVKLGDFGISIKAEPNEDTDILMYRLKGLTRAFSSNEMISALMKNSKLSFKRLLDADKFSMLATFEKCINQVSNLHKKLYQDKPKIYMEFYHDYQEMTAQQVLGKWFKLFCTKPEILLKLGDQMKSEGKHSAVSNIYNLSKYGQVIEHKLLPMIESFTKVENDSLSQELKRNTVFIEQFDKVNFDGKDENLIAISKKEDGKDLIDYKLPEFQILENDTEWRQMTLDIIESQLIAKAYMYKEIGQQDPRYQYQKSLLSLFSLSNSEIHKAIQSAKSLKPIKNDIDKSYLYIYSLTILDAYNKNIWKQIQRSLDGVKPDQLLRQQVTDENDKELIEKLCACYYLCELFVYLSNEFGGMTSHQDTGVVRTTMQSGGRIMAFGAMQMRKGMGEHTFFQIDAKEQLHKRITNKYQMMLNSRLIAEFCKIHNNLSLALLTQQKLQTFMVTYTQLSTMNNIYQQTADPSLNQFIQYVVAKMMDEEFEIEFNVLDDPVFKTYYNELEYKFESELQELKFEIRCMETKYDIDRTQQQLRRSENLLQKRKNLVGDSDKDVLILYGLISKIYHFFKDQDKTEIINKYYFKYSKLSNLTLIDYIHFCNETNQQENLQDAIFRFRLNSPFINDKNWNFIANEVYSSSKERIEEFKKNAQNQEWYSQQTVYFDVLLALREGHKKSSGRFNIWHQLWENYHLYKTLYQFISRYNFPQNISEGQYYNKEKEQVVKLLVDVIYKQFDIIYPDYDKKQEELEKQKKQ
eukprot:403370201